MIPYKDIVGVRFGRLTVVKKVAKSEKGLHGTLWLCNCDCGVQTIVDRNNLNTGNTQSCGCLGRERRLAGTVKHHKTNTRLHRIWKAMKTRCYNKNFHAYKYYGERGITICDEWKNDFNAFYAWANSNGYREDLTIDRINTNLEYSPENCRWATMQEQNQNKRAPNGFKIKE